MKSKIAIFFILLFSLKVNAQLCLSGCPVPLTNPVTGTGTLNYIPVFTSPSTLGNSSLFDNGNIGYGTTSPAAPFHIVTSASTVTNFNAQIILQNSDHTNLLNYSGIDFRSSVTGGGILTTSWIYARRTAQTISSSTTQIEFYTSPTGDYTATPKMIISNTSVNIGTNFNYNGSTPTNGYFLETDASGNASWAAVPQNTVTITGAGTTTVTGTYPNFTINTPNVIYTQTLSLTSAQILSLNTVPVLAIPSVSGYSILVLSAAVKFTFVTTAYAGTNPFILYAASQPEAVGSAQLATPNSAVTFVNTRSLKFTASGGSAPTTSQSTIVQNDNINVGTTGAITTGDGTAYIIIQYLLIPYPF